MSCYFYKRRPLIISFFIGFIIYINTTLYPQQIDIPRIELMPNMPSPYKMRNWKEVTLGYDSLVFNYNLTGQYLPLFFWWQTRINYTNHPSFGIHAYVGTSDPNAGEAITVLPAVISASLVGIDKSTQNGQNWALMCEEYFNRRPEENVYLNHPSTSSGSDWWYDTMPNVFFYQLYDKYPNTGDYNYQFTTVADRWLEAVIAMGGNSTPWEMPNMYYRAWRLASMTPNDQGVPEPEAAGAIAWILYNAFTQTLNPKYLVGAEWAMEYIDDLFINPSYELQLPYGVYMAARMNAEIGTQYNVEKMINWCFEVGSLRNWGAIVGNWGGYDCHGLIGEALGSGYYAFYMNGVEQVGALVPIVRYDDRFSRAVAKWVLNVANASRLFYSNFLPAEKQDNEDWTQQYDPHSYIAYEALRKIWNSQSPYATGDAMQGGWAATNLGLYGSSHVGILGGIIDTTDVEMILKLDALKTDYFHQSAYPTFLYFNPYSIDTTITINIGTGQYDLYDAVSNTFVKTGVAGETFLTLPADNVVLLVITPAGGNITYDLDRMLVNGVVIDFRSGQIVTNYPPRIKSLAASKNLLLVGDSTTVYCTAEDRDDDTLSYNWSTEQGILKGAGSVVQWNAPDQIGNYTITCIIEDEGSYRDTAEVFVEVSEYINQTPIILNLTAQPRKIDLNNPTQVVCEAIDPDNNTLVYQWSANYGTLIDSGSTAIWTAPNSAGNYTVKCIVSDNKGGQAQDSIIIVVRDFSQHEPGQLLAYYPFNNNANDESGNGHHGAINGATLVADRFGNPNSAFYFDGSNDFISIPNHDSLNVQDAITINFWMNVAELFNRESFPISHASWENRWKVSLIPEKKLRWTINTNMGIKDLDSETILSTNVWYNITVCYDGSDFEIYLNSELNNFSTWSGKIKLTSIDLTIGQNLPTDTNYNFKGILDDIRMYDYGLSVQEIQDLYSGASKIEQKQEYRLPKKYFLHQNYPNPFNPVTTISFEIPEKTRVSLKIYNVIGEEIATLVDKEMFPGIYELPWDASKMASEIYFYQLSGENFIQTKKMILLR